jgi:glycosyltransferase involved in cell wall biosynthesis
MRVLLATPVAPDVDGSGAIPVLLAAELLGLRELHDVTVVTAIGDERGEAEAVERLRDGLDVHVADRRRPPPGSRRLRRQGRMAARWARGRWPWRTVWFADPGLQETIDVLGSRERFDVVAVEDSAMSVFRYPAGAATVYTHHEVLRPRPIARPPAAPLRWPRWAFDELDWLRWPGFQRRAWARFDRVQVFSRRDAETISAQDPAVAARVRVNPFGIVLPAPADPAREVAGMILFVGNFAHPPNRDAAIWLAREIMPLVRASHPGGRLRIVGTAPTPEVLELAGPGVEVIGDAAAVEPHVEEAAVVLAPVRTGSGMRMKVLQAIAAGKAVVTTARGAEGFNCFDEEPPLLIADGADGIATATSGLLEDDSGRRALGARARAFAERHHSPRAWAERLTEVYEEARSGVGVEASNG